MQPTRQLGAVAGLVVALAFLAVVTGRQSMLWGAVLVGGWLLGQAGRFARDLERTVASLSVEQTPARTAPQVNDAVPVTLLATLERPAPVALSIEAGLPAGAASEAPLSVPLESGETVAERTVDVTWPVVGHHRFEAATVTAANDLFRERVPAGRRPTVAVVRRGPRSIHVGTGGDRLPMAVGEHEAAQTGSGIEPAELREYVPGDTTQRIDWKATARLGTPHVREFEAETDRRSLLVVDHRATLAVGPPGETKLDYLRGAVLALVDGVRAVDDPVALLTVGDGGVTDWRDFHTAPDEYQTVRRRLFDLEPTPAESGPEPASSREAGPSPVSAVAGSQPTSSVDHVDDRTTAADVTRHLAALEGDADEFARSLRPFLYDRQIYRERIGSEPLYGAVRSRLARQRGFVWTAIFSDDAHPAELRETVKLARADGNEVAVFLAPTVLHEPGGLADVERAYERYVAFERFRRELSRMERVTAFEVGPGDRLATVLEAGRSRGGRS